MRRNLVKVLEGLHRLGVRVTIANTPPSGGFAVRIGDPAAPQAEKHFTVNQVELIADWLVVNVQDLAKDRMTKALLEL